MNKKNDDARTRAEWVKFMAAVTNGDTDTTIREKTGVHNTTVGRWRRGEVDPSPRQVVAFARAYGQSPIAALIAAEYLNEQELHLPATGHRVYTLDDFSTLELAEEVVRRLDHSGDYRTEVSERTSVMNVSGTKDDVALAAFDQPDYAEQQEREIEEP